MSKFYSFTQNNSGGSFEYDDKAGIAEYVIVEAVSADHASARAQDIGLYFDGCQDGRDCPCCGDRWYESFNQSYDVPSIYGKPVSDDEVGNRWREDGPSVYVHYLDGRIVGYPSTPTGAAP